MDDVEKIIEQVLLSESNTFESGVKVLDEIIDKVKTCASRIKLADVDGDSSSPSRTATSGNTTSSTDRKRKAIRDLCDELTAGGALKKIKLGGKKLHNDISKLGKLIDSTFHCDTSWIQGAESPNIQKVDLDKAVLRHLLRKGYFDVAEKFMEESKIDASLLEPDLSKYEEMHAVLISLEKKELKLAMEWLKKSKNRLKDMKVMSTELEFQLHRAQFVLLSQSGKYTEAIEYAQSELVQFKDVYTREIQQLMGGLVFLNNNVEKMEELGRVTFDRLREVFLDMCCSLYDIEKDSYLEICLRAGEVALPRLMKYFKVIKLTDTAKPEQAGEKGTITPSISGWNSLEELPVEICLNRDMRYHSVFTCPISREQTSEENPPVLLRCGHVVAKASTAKIVKSNGRIKCPTCPKEQSLTDVRVLHF